MIPKLFAFDLDGTLLDSNKCLRPANTAAIREMRAGAAVIALVSGRLGASVRRYAEALGGCAVVALNGAEVFAGAEPGAEMIYYAPLSPDKAGYLTSYGDGKPIAVNFYYDDKLYGVKSNVNSEWMELYTRQTGVEYELVDSFVNMSDLSPSKIIFVGGVDYIDEQESIFRSLWRDDEVYVCRSWDHYLEFMSPQANKGIGLRKLCEALGIDISDTAAYGDAENDIPMIQAAGFGAAMKNAVQSVKSAANRVTDLTNDDDWVVKEWELVLG